MKDEGQEAAPYSAYSSQQSSFEKNANFSVFSDLSSFTVIIKQISKIPDHDT